MGYTIDIGEAVLTGSKEDLYLRVGVEPRDHDDAPSFENDPLTGKGNSRSPSYSVWTDMCRETGLYPMFYGLNGRRNPYMEPDPDCHRETPILAEHPGFVLIGERDVEEIKAALDRHIAAHGELVPGFRPWLEADDKAPANADACATRARLIWLHYWADWAVKNCKWPIIANA